MNNKAKKITAIILFLFSFYILSMHYQAVVDAVNIKQEKSRYAMLLKEEQEKNTALKEKQKNLDSDKYYEEIARDNLGFLKSNEVLYINADNK